MTPPHAHTALQVWFNSGLFANRTAGVPGVQGAGITGAQGIGVSAPIAAAVAAATCGFAIEEHIPKDVKFFIGTLSIIVAIGTPPANARFSGVTISVEGAAPKLQAHAAPAQTQKAIFRILRTDIQIYIVPASILIARLSGTVCRSLS